MKRFLERPSLAHVVTTCFGLMYLLIFASGWISILTNPFFDNSLSSWAAFVGFGLLLGWLGWFLIRELVRQARLIWQQRSS